MMMESLNRARMHPENQDPAKQRAIKKARNLLIAARVNDPGSKKGPEPFLTRDPYLLLERLRNKSRDGKKIHKGLGGGCGTRNLRARVPVIFVF